MAGETKDFMLNLSGYSLTDYNLLQVSLDLFDEAGQSRRVMGALHTEIELR